jgi:hypothetical protein
MYILKALPYTLEDLQQSFRAVAGRFYGEKAEEAAPLGGLCVKYLTASKAQLRKSCISYEAEIGISRRKSNVNINSPD